MTCKYQFVLILLAILLFASGCSKKAANQSESTKNQAIAASEETAVSAEQIAEMLKKLPPKPQYDKNLSVVPAPLILSELKKLPAEQIEAEVLKSFSIAVPKDSDDVLAIRKLADQKNQEAMEALGAYYIAFPFVDQRYWKGREYLSQVEHFTHPENAFIRARYEYFEDKNNIPRAMPFFTQAAQSDLPEIQYYLLNHPELGLARQAWDRLNTIYTKSAQSDNAHDIYELAKLYRDFPEFKDPERYAIWSEKARSLFYPEALYDDAAGNINTTPQSSIETLKSLAKDGYPLANALLATLYLNARVSKLPDPSSSKFSPALQNVLKDDIANMPDTLLTASLLDYAHKSAGIPMTCFTMFTLSAAGEDPVFKDIHDETAACLEAYALKSETREACGTTIDNMFNFEDKAQYHKFFSPENQKRIGQARLSCLQNVLGNGVIYPQTAYPLMSTSLLIANIYHGDIIETIPSDLSRYIQYLILGATLFDDFISQIMLAGEYTVEGRLVNDPKRVCYWSQKAHQHPICTQTCHKVAGSPNGDVAVLLDADISEDELESIYMACSVCQSADNLVTQFCQ